MERKPWFGPRWPEGVSHEISGYERPLFSLLDDAARDFPDRTYTLFAGGAQTFKQVRNTADRIANFLRSKGIQSGDRVAVFLPNLPHYPPIFFGILKAGGICVTCNPLYKASELNFQLNDSGATAVFVMDHPAFYPTTLEAIRNTQVRLVVICNVRSYLPPLKGFLGSLLGKIPKAPRHESGHFLFHEVIAEAEPVPPRLPLDPLEDLALILYTGGTTGTPKGAALTHANMVYDAMALEEWAFTPQEKDGAPQRWRRGGYHCYLGLLPWYHSFGMTCCMLFSCLTGNKMVCFPDPRAGNPPFTEALKAVQHYRVTVIPAVPTIFAAFVNHPLLRKFDLSSVIACPSGGAPLPVQVAKQFESCTGSIIFEGYGLSETAPVVAANPANLETRKFGSVGLPMPGTDIKILDIETGSKELALGEEGEIAVSGPQVMKGYWNRTQETEAVFREIQGRRYFLTGDIGRMDEDGFVVITDRKKDLIIVGGFNVYPTEIEEILYTHPKVALAAVIGVPDARSGEVVKAFIQLKAGVAATVDEFAEFCKEKMAGYKRPREIEFRDALPTSLIGKVLRRVLRDEEMKKRAPQGVHS